VWVDAQSFDVADHVRVFSLPAPAGEAQLLACEHLRRQRGLTGGRRQREDADMVGDVEGLRVDPHWPAETERRPVQDLPEARNQMQPRLDLAPDGIDPQLTVAVEQPGALGNSE